YMKKPIVLFQFDRDEYRSGHQGVGYFDPDQDGFGPVGLDVERTVDLVAGYLERNCELEDLYADRIREFFKYTDAENCKRNFEAILEVLK
ncbi:MAG: CDP-glycerol glycerophosphotransferase family protein, partial [Fibrobacter sp.]|nr:CDP-glycerol glycerophosphotransferase family protein [Fibrobacter sp.]